MSKSIHTGEIITRAEYDALTPQQKSAFFNAGGQIATDKSYRELASFYGLSERHADAARELDMTPDQFRAYCVAKAISKR